MALPVLPPQWQNPQKPLYKSFIFWRRDLAYFLAISGKKRYTVTEVCEKEVLGQPWGLFFHENTKTRKRQKG